MLSVFIMKMRHFDKNWPGTASLGLALITSLEYESLYNNC